MLHDPLYELLKEVEQRGDNSQVFLLSLGIIDDLIVRLIQDFWLAYSTITPDVVVYLWTFQGRLTLTA